MVVSIAGFVVLLASKVKSYEGLSADDVAAAMTNQYMGTVSIVALACSMAFVLLYRRKRLFTEDLCPKGISFKTMPAGVFLACILLTFTVQVISMGSDLVIESAARILGYKVMPVSNDIQQSMNTAGMMLYSGIIAPVVEEIIFRGVIQNGLRKYGRLFAIITSSLLFAFFHSDIEQGLFAFLMGLILGFTAMEYSVKWSMALHIFNNLVLGIVLSKLTGSLPLAAAETVQMLIILTVGILGGILVLCKALKPIQQYLAENKTQPQVFKTAWTSVWFLLFLAVEFVSALQSGFVKIG